MSDNETADVGVESQYQLPFNAENQIETSLDGLRNRPVVQISNAESNIPVEDACDPMNLSKSKKSEAELKTLKIKKLTKFYKNQNELIDEILAPIEPLSTSEIERASFKVNIAIYGSSAVNVMLFILQLLAAIFSGSLSLFATMADAFMDLLSSAIMMTTNYFTKKSEMYKYPSGKGRVETVGIVVFGSLMATLSLQVIIQAVTSVIGTPQPPDLGIISISFVGVAFISKLCLYLYCRLVDDPSAQVLAQDHRNDLLLNSVGLAFGLLGAEVNPYLDPIGAILVALIILISWSSTVLEHSQLIVGKCADHSFLKRVTYIAMTHDDRILQIDTCRAYHAGSKVIVEVDIVLPPETTLAVAHDLGESLQIKLESLPNVDRAFVHCDYETTHRPEHRKFA